MSTGVDARRLCRRCSAALSGSELACSGCGALVHADELNRKADSARRFETAGDFAGALAEWRQALELLPPATTQAAWIRERVAALSSAAMAGEPEDADGGFRNKAIGALVSLIAFGVFFATQFGVEFAVGLSALILIHELGHYVDIRRRGLPADMPMFLPGLGAYVRWKAQGVSLETRAAISLAGPLAGLLAAIACAALYYATAEPRWAMFCRAGAWLNLANLTPIWILDGGQAALALSRLQRVGLLLVVVAAWGVTRESVLFLVLLGAMWSIFAKDAAQRPSARTLVYFAAVLALLAAILSQMPGHGAALP